MFASTKHVEKRKLCGHVTPNSDSPKGTVDSWRNFGGRPQQQKWQRESAWCECLSLPRRYLWYVSSEVIEISNFKIFSLDVHEASFAIQFRTLLQASFRGLSTATLIRILAFLGLWNYVIFRFLYTSFCRENDSNLRHLGASSITFQSWITYSWGC